MRRRDRRDRGRRRRSTSSAATRARTAAPARRRGWEHVEALALEREAPRVAEQAVALLTADPCPSGVMDVVIDAEQMQLQVHESVGHPTELDRVYGTEAVVRRHELPASPATSARCGTAPST